MKYLRHIYWLITLLLVSNLCFANDTLVMGQLLKRIADLQCKQSGVFPKGIIPTYRLYALNKTREKAEVTNFTTGLVDMTLRDISPQLTQHQQDEAELIIDRSLEVFPKFLNRKGKPTYNFWPTDTPKIFTNSGWINLFDKKQALPDDLDCTAISLLALNSPDSTASKVHTLMQLFTNRPEKKIQNTFKEYQLIGAYSTWFGVKMPIDFDVCVLSNVLYFVQRYHLDWTAADSASLEFIEKVVTEKKYIQTSEYVSPHYSRTPVILYHLARLMSVKPIVTLEKLKPQLIKEAQDALAHTSQFMDQIILSTALLRWGVNPPVKEIRFPKSLESLIEENSFAFYIGNMGSMLPNPWKKWIVGSYVGKFYYISEAYNNLLVLEYLALKKKYNY